MAKREYIQRHLLIIQRLKNNPSSFEELKKYLIQQQEITGDNFDITQRTFQRDLHEINSIYGVEIKFNKREKYYEIIEEEHDKPFERIIEAFETLSALNFSDQLSHKLLLEKKGGKGTEHMHGLLYAIDNYREVSFTHHSFWKENAEYRTLRPVAIKEAQNRWYLIGWDLEKNDYRNFGLDRITDLEITTQKFKPIKYDVNAAYQHAFGIETQKPAEKVIVSFNDFQAKYIKSKPIHTSQKIIFEEENLCRFEYFIHPTEDFIMEIMKYSDAATVEEPQWLVENIKNRIQKMINKYN